MQGTRLVRIGLSAGRPFLACSFYFTTFLINMLVDKELALGVLAVDIAITDDDSLRPPSRCYRTISP
jgi:hypothetical protein